MTTCSCGTPTGDNAYLCSTCRTDVHTALSNTPALITDLTLTMTKQRRFGDPNLGSRSADHGLPYNMAAANLLREYSNELLALVRSCLVANLHGSTMARQPDSNASSMALWLLPRLGGMVGQPWAADTMRLVTLSSRAEHVIDAPADKVFAGPCDQCGNDLYARAGKQRVTCHDCELSYDLAARRAWLLRLVDDRLATATECARALTSLEMPVTAERIRQWKHRDRLAASSHDRLGRPLYRVGDVVTLLVQQAERAS